MRYTRTVLQLDKLTEKQKRFIDYYVETGNATEAAILAGYSEKTAKQIGSENLSKLDSYIKERLKPIDNKRIADADEVLQYLTAVMRGEVKDTFDFDTSVRDRNKAAELLGKRHRLFIDKVEQENTGVVNINFAIPRPKKGN
jgi:phage terminase small subunit